jgi:hypothetical protein
MSVDYEEFLDEVSRGADIPIVEVSDLESVCGFLTLSRQFAVDRSDPCESVSFDSELLAEKCSPGANVFAVLLRAACLEAAYKDSRLAQFKDQAHIHNTALQVIATVPLNAARLQDVPWLVERIESAAS